MVTAAFYFATLEDQATLLNYLGEPDNVTLHPWPVVRNPLDALSRGDALATPQVMVVNRDLGQAKIGAFATISPAPVPSGHYPGIQAV